MNKKLISILVMIGIWQGLAILTNREVLLPQPIHVFNRIFELLLSSQFYKAVLITLFRSHLSFLLALLGGIITGLIAYFNKNIEAFLSPILTFFQTIPQISFMIVLIVWFDQFTCIIIIILLMTFPTVYHNVLTGLKNIDNSLKDIILLYYHPLPFTITKVYLPLIKPYIYSAIESILPLSLKVGVMAEVLIQARVGIGKELYFSRLNIDMTGVFAWTICLVAILMIEMTLVRKIVTHKR